MTKKTIKVLARVTARPDKVEEVKSLLRGLVGETRRENGCISYHLLQNKADSCDFTFVEEWASDSAIDAHFTTAHMQDAFSKALSLLAKEPNICRYVVIE